MQLLAFCSEASVVYIAVKMAVIQNCPHIHHWREKLRPVWLIDWEKKEKKNGNGPPSPPFLPKLILLILIVELAIAIDWRQRG